MIDQNGASESENKFETNHAMGGDLRSTHGSTPRTSDTGDATATNQKLDGNADSDVNPEFVNPEFDENPGMGFGFTEADDLAAEIAAAKILSVGLPSKNHGADHDGSAEFAATGDHFDAVDGSVEGASGGDDRDETEAAADAEDAAAAYARASMRDFDRPADEASSVDGEDDTLAHRGEKPKQLVVVNDIPGEETRIAILEQGKLAQFFTERAATSTNVGSIYKARVVNVEPAIQAAFVDFGEGANGFLHISDLHPKYFPKKHGRDEDGDGDEKVRTEKVGRKIPRRARPMMQEALKRGQEITVQVLKEGLGSKGPTVTSYLSIPGRLLVMMPDMDNVGVSRKVDDEEGRRKMRKILDSLDLPKGFGFILRTAGFDATRTELARDAQYLTRLWQVMEKRMNAVGAPCQLYAEGDILLRTIRDSIDSSVDGIVVDSESAFSRARAFLEVVAPKAAAKVHFYDRRRPIFHAFDVERQVDLIHAREVPLPSGGALVFDQAEALVAIDVNSGRSRSARDSETNAYQTNQEAVDEIARQLRLRDLGGVVICDLIDMRASKHRREIEERFKKHLSRDRAKTTVSEIGEFGILELTRQRMRPSLRKTHYMDCPHCAGHGEIRMPESVASDALRRMQLVFDMERVARLELVCSAKVAAVLLSRKRRAMVELEDLFSKKIDVRISEAIAVDRVDIYAYDDRGADVDLDKPQKFHMPALASFPTEIEEDDEDSESGSGSTDSRSSEERQGGGRRRRRRRRKPAAADATSIILSGGFDDLPEIDEEEPSFASALERQEAAKREAERAAREAAAADDEGDEEDADGEEYASGEDARRDGTDRSAEQGEGGGRRRRRRRRRGRGGRDGKLDRDGSGDAPQADGDTPSEVAAPSKSSPARSVPTKPVAPPPPPREPSDPIRVHAIAKEIELTSKEVLAKCAELGIEVKGHQSMLTGEQGDAIRKAYGKPPFDVAEVVEATEPTQEVEMESATEGSDGDSGEGGGRRKRRRRRRGRGRGGRDADGRASNGDDDGARATSGSEDSEDSDDSSDTGSDVDSDDDRSDDSSNGDDAPSDSSDESPDENSGDDRGEGGGRRRRRRRRGGRGRNKNRDENGRAPSTSASSASTSGEQRDKRGGSREQGRDRGRDQNRNQGRDQGREQNRGGDRGGQRGGQRGKNRDRNRSDAPSSSPASSTAASPASAAPSGNESRPSDAKPVPPKPRSLYGGRVRKLSPGERPSGGGDE
jgi:ribonuclease E